jgi:hypothetical protein
LIALLCGANTTGAANMKDKLKNISKVNADIKYLKDEYEKVKMWGNCPDGDLKFDALMDWLDSECNVYMIEHMIKTVKIIKAI